MRRAEKIEIATFSQGTERLAPWKCVCVRVMFYGMWGWEDGSEIRSEEAGSKGLKFESSRMSVV